MRKTGKVEYHSNKRIFHEDGELIARFGSVPDAEFYVAVHNASEGMTTEEAVIRLTYEPSASVKLFFAAKGMDIDEAVACIKAIRKIADELITGKIIDAIDRVEMLHYNALDIHTDEAVKYLKHGPEMEKAIRAVYSDIELQNVSGGSNELNFLVASVLAKLDKEGQ